MARKLFLRSACWCTWLLWWRLSAKSVLPTSGVSHTLHWQLDFILITCKMNQFWTYFMCMKCWPNSNILSNLFSSQVTHHFLSLTRYSYSSQSHSARNKVPLFIFILFFWGNHYLPVFSWAFLGHLQILFIFQGSQTYKFYHKWLLHKASLNTSLLEIKMASYWNTYFD